MQVSMNGIKAQDAVGKKVVFGDNKSNTRLRTGEVTLFSDNWLGNTMVSIRADDTNAINIRSIQEVYVTNESIS